MIDMKDAQSIFDTVAKHLLTQGEQSYDEVYGCLYRGPEGRTCAIGCLIDDKYYDPDMEGRNIDGLYDEFFGMFPDGFFQHRKLLAALQEMHDGLPPQLWADELMVIAEAHNLNKRVVEDHAGDRSGL